MKINRKLQENNVRQNWNISPNFLTDEQIENWTSNIEKMYPYTDGKTLGNSGSEIRSSKIRWATGDTFLTDFLFHFVNDFAQKTGIHVYKKCEIQYTEYDAKYKGHYSMHHDIDFQRNDGIDRKVSITVQLSDPSEYEGGDFVFDLPESPDPKLTKQKGTILVFPSYHMHAVMPITKGLRKSLVAWFYGPQWK